VAAVGALLVLGAAMVAWQQYRESRAHAMRTAAVRDFMFDLVNDAEADDAHGGGEVTGRQMVDGAVRRARGDFSAQPQLQGELLGELGRMYNRLGAPEKAVPVLTQAVATLEKNAPAADPALNKSRVYLADALLQSSEDLQRVGALATQARDACVDGGVDCAKARAYAGNILSQLASFRGDSAAALAAMRQSAVDAEAGFGTAHEETVMALMSVAIIARNSGQLVEADTAMRRAVAIADKLRMHVGDRLSLERTMAVIDYDLGRYQEARARLSSLIAHTADPKERALQLRILANVYVDLEDGAQALQAADAAIALISGEQAAAQLPFALQARARALGLLGRHDEALVEIDRAMAAMLAVGRTAESAEMMRAQRVRAELLLQGGNPRLALDELKTLRAVQQRGAMPAVDAGLMLDTLGAVQLAGGDARAALASHDAAHRELLKQLPEGHPYLVRNAALRAAAVRLAH
jgi:tetratricopeptide (TPR) repeat protein